MKLKIIIVEDKPLLAADISDQLEEMGYNVLDIFASGEEFLRKVEVLKPDLILMDVRLKGNLDGIDTVRELNHIGTYPVIYLTAHGDARTVKRATSTAPSAYLTKPFDKKDLYAAIELAIHNFQERTTLSKNKEESDSIFLKKNARFVRVAISEIQYMEASGSYSSVFTEDAKYTMSINLNALGQKISHSSLIRIHRSYVVNIKRIDALDGNRIFIGEKELPVSKSYRSALEQKLRLV